MKTPLIMGRAIFSLLIICFFVSCPICHAQKIQVSDPRLELKDNIIHISYDILNDDPSDNFIVSVHIKDANGNRIAANSMSGDIGEGVGGGNNKHITWDLDADNIFMNSRIYVKINVNAIPVPEPVIAIQETDQPEGNPSGGKTQHKIISRDDATVKEEITKKETSTAAELERYTRSGLILQSLTLPGLGLSRMTGKPHWLRGVAGYGCIAGSVVLNRQAVNTYGGISDLEDYNEKNDLFQKSQSQDNISEVLAYAAIGIWVTDFIWTFAGTSDLKKDPFLGDVSGFSLKTTIDPLTYAPLVGIRYRF